MKQQKKWLAFVLAAALTVVSSPFTIAYGEIPQQEGHISAPLGLSSIASIDPSSVTLEKGEKKTFVVKGLVGLDAADTIWSVDSTDSTIGASSGELTVSEKETKTLLTVTAKNQNETATAQVTVAHTHTADCLKISYVSAIGEQEFVNMDVSEASPKSDYFIVSLRCSKISEISMDTPMEVTVLGEYADKLTATKASHDDHDDSHYYSRLALKDGVTDFKGTHTIPLQVTVNKGSENEAVFTKDADDEPLTVQLYAEAADPVYTDGTAVIELDVDNLQPTYTSSPVKLKIPGGVRTIDSIRITDGYLAENNVVTLDGENLTVTFTAKNGSYNHMINYIPLEITFKARTVPLRFTLPIEYRITTPDVVTVQYNKEIDLAKTNYTELEAVASEKYADVIDQCYRVEVTDIRAETGAFRSSGNRIFVNKAGTASFDVDTDVRVKLMDEYGGGYLTLSATASVKNLPIQAMGVGPNDEVWVYRIKGQDRLIDLNDLSTYAKELGIRADAGITVDKIMLNEASAKLFTMEIGEPGSDNQHPLTLTLKNDASVELSTDSYEVGFIVTATVEGKQKNYPFIYNIDFVATDPSVKAYRYNTDQVITKDAPVAVGTSRKYTLRADNLEPDSYFYLYASDDITIVRGERFYSDMGVSEHITLHRDEATEEEITSLSARVKYTPKLTNLDVQVKATGNDWYFNYDLIEFDNSGTVVPPVDDDDDNNDSGSGGSGGGGSGSGSAADKPSGSVNDKGEVKSEDLAKDTTKAIQDAIGSGAGKNANVVVKNAQSIAPEAFKEMAAAAAKAGGNVQLMADTVVNGKVEARLYINPALAAKLTAPISLGVKMDEKSVKYTMDKFANFDNNLAVASFAQQGKFGMSIRAAIKVDLTKLNTKTLRFYSYDKATNTYFVIASSGYQIDKNGYLYFTTDRGGDIIITDKPLTLKK